MSKIVITMQGGVIQNICNIPDGIQIEIHDYDTEGVDPENLNTDEFGDLHTMTLWEADGTCR